VRRAIRPEIGNNLTSVRSFAGWGRRGR
jgi:hypothetical protein